MTDPAIARGEPSEGPAQHLPLAGGTARLAAPEAIGA